MGLTIVTYLNMRVGVVVRSTLYYSLGDKEHTC